MCDFFSFVTDPIHFPGQKFYFDWEYRKENLTEMLDSHSFICKHFNLKEDDCNKYEYNPLLKKFYVDQTNSTEDDAPQCEVWVSQLNFSRIVEPLILKPILNPFTLPKVAIPTQEQIKLLKSWASVWASVWGLCLFIYQYHLQI